MSAFTVCTVHYKFYPCGRHSQDKTCRFTSNQDDVWAVGEHILTRQDRELKAQLRSAVCPCQDGPTHAIDCLTWNGAT